MIQGLHFTSDTNDEKHSPQPSFNIKMGDSFLELPILIWLRSCLNMSVSINNIVKEIYYTSVRCLTCEMRGAEGELSLTSLV